MATFQCSVCSSDFERSPSRNRGRGIYCSRQCFGLDHKGQSNTRYHLGRGSGFSLSEETREKIRQSQIGKHITLEMRQKMSTARMGRKPTLETKEKMSAAQKVAQNKPELKALKSEWQRGEKHWHWKGGVSGKKRLDRASTRYRDWREKVFRRDNWTCRVCGQRGRCIHPHHVLSFAKCPDFRFDLFNGLTLCVPCHKLVHFGGALRA